MSLNLHRKAPHIERVPDFGSPYDRAVDTAFVGGVVVGFACTVFLYGLFWFLGVVG